MKMKYNFNWSFEQLVHKAIVSLESLYTRICAYVAQQDKKIKTYIIKMEFKGTGK